MRKIVVTLATGLILAAPAVSVQTTPVSKEEAQHWIRYTVPLPKQIELSGKAILPARQVLLRTVGDGGAALIQQATKELQEALGVGDAPALGGEGLFTITLQLGGDEADVLKKCKYADQSYLIRPTRDGKGLLCVAIGPRGLYYASKTLQQLIKAKFADGRVEMPVVKVTDSPDIEDRGMWGNDTSSHLRWMSDRKMNYLEHISQTTVDKDKKCRVSFPPYKQRIIDEGPTYGIEPVPVVLHLEQLKSMGLFDAYPELQGKDATRGVICYSNPKFSDVLAEWLVLWGETPGISEVDVWMTENMSGMTSCQCGECRKEERAVLEARSIVKAWDIARKQLPNLGLRMLTSEASEDCNAKFIPTLPKDVKLWYYHSLFTYNTSRAPMIGHFQPYLIDAVKAGRWVGICSNISADVGLWTPMSSAAFIRARMNEFVDKGLSGLLAYSVHGMCYYWFNIEATAEWSWNAKGRSTREFALSYAVRRGYQDPERFAEWSETLGPVSWDVYGSAFPTGEQRDNPGKLADLVKNGKLPELGFVLWEVYGIPFGDIKTVDQLNHDVVQAQKGVKLARDLGLPVCLEESLVVQGYINAIKALWELKQVVKPGGVADTVSATKWFQAYLDGLAQAREHLPLWEKALPERGSNRHKASDCVELLTGMIDGMKETAKGFGIEVK